MQVAEESHVGLAVTHRRFDGGGWNGAGLVETSLRLSDNYTWSALAALTRTDEPDDAELSAILPDRAFEVGGDSITVAFDGQDFGGHVLKTSLVRQSRTWNFNLSYQDYSPGFRADNSAIFSNDGRILHTQQTYNVHFDDHRLLNFVRPGMYLWRKTDYEGDVKDIGVRPSVLFAFQHQTFLNVSGFLFNQEKFRDVEFDDARAVWAYLGSNAFERVSGGIFFNRGEVINRFGVVGSQHDPFELVPSFEWNANLTLKPTERLTAGLRYNDSELRTDAGDELIVRQRIFRHSLQYQFTRELFVRFVGELDRTRRAEAVDGYDESTFYSFEPMLSYRLNAFSVFYLGGDFGLTEDPYINRDGLARTDQTLFLKFQYLMQAN
jgi:hypothetical protein